jgi:hypothetical protein
MALQLNYWNAGLAPIYSKSAWGCLYIDSTQAIFATKTSSLAVI